MTDIITCESISEFAKLTSRKHGFDNCTYEINQKKISYAIDIVKFFSENFLNEFYGFSLTPDGEDGILRIRVQTFFLDDPCDFKTLFKHAESVKFIPLEEHFVVEVCIKSMYRLCDDEEFENI